MRPPSLLVGAAAVLGVTGAVIPIPPAMLDLTCGAASALTVETTGGTVHGTIDPSTPCVRRFLGIPYAQPPVGELRFAPPQPPHPFGKLQANTMPPACMQFRWTSPPSIYSVYLNEFNVGGPNQTAPAVSEDCLTLSVWAPASPNAQHGRLPVLVWLHGGAFIMGGQNVPYQIPAPWVQSSQGFVIVTLDYRLNIFGFPNAAGLPNDKQNVGLLDQRMAIQWVRDNIAAFGGDPNRITLWGQSAGAISTGFYQYAYPSDPVVKGFIMDSGSELLRAGVLATADATHVNFTNVADKVGCGGLGPEEELTCMRSDNVSALAIETAIQAYNEAGQLLLFTPVIDGVTAFSDYHARSVAGQLAKLPTIIGTNADEGVAFVPLQAGGRINETEAAAATLAFFLCPAVESVADRLAAGLPVYRYFYAGNFTNVSPQGFLGAYHESELPLLFGTDDEFRGPSTPLEEETSRAMQDAWLAFASAGTEGMAEVGWPKFNFGTGEVREFGAAGVAVRDIQLRDEQAKCAPIIGVTALVG